MIYTVTFNPSIDYIVDVDGFEKEKLNRTSGEKILPGGKGINVSIVLNNLGHENAAVGFAAGFTGKELCRIIDEAGITADLILLKEGFTRINVKVRSGAETEINGRGPDINEKFLDKLMRRIALISSGDILVLSGSIPDTIPDTIYADIMACLSEKNVRIVVDATGDLLMNVLKYRPFLIKPNNYELGEIFGIEIKTREEAVPYAMKLKKMGAENVLVSMGGEGSVLVSEDGSAYMSEAPKGEVKNTIGAGDSMVAGFIAGYLETGDYGEALKMGACAGSASAFSEELATREEVENLMETIKITKK